MQLPAKHNIGELLYSLSCVFSPYINHREYCKHSNRSMFFMPSCMHQSQLCQQGLSRHPEVLGDLPGATPREAPCRAMRTTAVRERKTEKEREERESGGNICNVGHSNNGQSFDGGAFTITVKTDDVSILYHMIGKDGVVRVMYVVT